MLYKNTVTYTKDGFWWGPVPYSKLSIVVGGTNPRNINRMFFVGIVTELSPSTSTGLNADQSFHPA